MARLTFDLGVGVEYDQHQVQGPHFDIRSASFGHHLTESSYDNLLRVQGELTSLTEHLRNVNLVIASKSSFAKPLITSRYACPVFDKP